MAVAALTRGLATAMAVLSSTGLRAQSTLHVPATVDTFPNGLTLVIHEDRSAPLVSVNIYYHVGSGDEQPGRTGFAHLFEHLMFMGSEHATYPQFDRLLEAAGADNSAYTGDDQTVYFENGTSHTLPLMLWLEADRMGWFLPTMDSAKVALQRDVVKNERRQRMENSPYGAAWDHLPGMQYLAGETYSWPGIGSMADLSAASLEDVKGFFQRYYVPNNATIVVAGAVHTDSVRALVAHYFDGIPRGPHVVRPPAVPRRAMRDTALVLEDQVPSARLYLSWPGVPSWAQDEAALDIAAYVLAGAKNSRLTQLLVYQRQVASEVWAFHWPRRIAGDFLVVPTARPGQELGELQEAIDSVVARLADEGPTQRELGQAKNAIEATFLNRIEALGGKADAINRYMELLGTPDGFQRDVDRYRAVTRAQVQQVVRKYLQGPRVSVSVVPAGKAELAAPARGSTP
jgi:zinc protease